MENSLEALNSFCELRCTSQLLQSLFSGNDMLQHTHFGTHLSPTLWKSKPDKEIYYIKERKRYRPNNTVYANTNQTFIMESFVRR